MIIKAKTLLLLPDTLVIGVVRVVVRVSVSPTSSCNLLDGQTEGKQSREGGTPHDGYWLIGTDFVQYDRNESGESENESNRETEKRQT